ECDARKNASYHLALNSDAPAVNDPHAAKTCFVSLLQVFFYNTLYVARWNGMQVKDITDLNRYWIGKGIEGIDVYIVFQDSSGFDSASRGRRRQSPEPIKNCHSVRLVDKPMNRWEKVRCCE